MDDKEGIGIADVTLDPNRKKNCQRRTCLYGCGRCGVNDRWRGEKTGSREVPGIWQRVLRLQSYTQTEGACDFTESLSFFAVRRPGPLQRLEPISPESPGNRK